MNKTLLEKLIGTWELVSFVETDEDGTERHPLGENLIGLVLYNRDGYMSVEMMATGEASEKYRGYSGRYEVDEQTQKVTHFIEVSSDTSALDQERTRVMTVEDDVLTVYNDEEPRDRLVWHRVAAQEKFKNQFFA